MMLSAPQETKIPSTHHTTGLPIPRASRGSKSCRHALSCLSASRGSGEWRRIYDRVEALLPRVEALAADRNRLEEIDRIHRELSEARQNAIGAASLAGPSAGSESMSGGAARAEWRRIYDRVEAQVEVLAAHNGIQHEFWNARDDINQHRLHQAELSRSRWEAACKELLPGDSPKFTELLASDLEDSRLCKALFEIENSELKVQLKDVGNCAQLNESHTDHENTTRDLREELRKLKQAYKTICSNKDKEISALLGVKDFLWNQLRTTEEENIALLKIKEVEASQAAEAAKKLQHSIEEMQLAALKLEQNIKEMQVAAQNKDNEIGRSQAEAVNAKKRECSQACSEDKHEMDPEDFLETSEDCSKDTDEMYTIFVNILDGKTMTLQVKRSETIYDVKDKIQNKEGIPACQQRFMFGNKLLVGSSTVGCCFIVPESTLTLHPVLQGMHIFAKMQKFSSMTFEVDRADTVYSVKAKIFDNTLTAPVMQLLYFDGKMLEEDRTLADYNIQNESTLHFVFSYSPTNKIYISVETESRRGREIIGYYALESEKVSTIKARIQFMLPIPLDQQCLFYQGKLLENDRTLEFYGINRRYSRSCIFLLQLRLPGG